MSRSSISDLQINSHVISELVLSATCFVSLLFLLPRRKHTYYLLWVIGIGLPLLTSLFGALKFGKLLFYQGFDITYLHSALNTLSHTLGVAGLALASLNCYSLPYLSILSWPLLLVSAVISFVALTDTRNEVFYGLVIQGLSVPLMFIVSLYQLGKGHPSAKWILSSIVLMVGGLVVLERLPATFEPHPIDLFHYMFALGTFCASLAPFRSAGGKKQKTK